MKSTCSNQIYIYIYIYNTVFLIYTSNCHFSHALKLTEKKDAMWRYISQQRFINLPFAVSVLKFYVPLLNGNKSGLNELKTDLCILVYVSVYGF